MTSSNHITTNNTSQYLKRIKSLATSPRESLTSRPLKLFKENKSRIFSSNQTYNVNELFMIFFHLFIDLLLKSFFKMYLCKENQHDAQLILSIFCQPVHVSDNRTTDRHLRRIINTSCSIHTVVPPDDGSRYARNTYRVTKYIYTKNKLCIMLVFPYTIISRCTVNKTLIF